MTASRFYSNVAVAGTLGASLSNSATSMYLSSTPVGYPASFPFTLALNVGAADFELVNVTSGAGTVGTPWVISRGYDGTVAQAHTGGTCTVQHDLSAADVYTSRLHEAMGSGSGVHGLPASAWQASSLAVINETVLANSTTTVQTFSSIPAIYNHLLLIVLGRLTETTALSDWITLQINGDSSASYSWLTVGANNNGGSLTAPFSFTTFATPSISLFRLAASQGGANQNAGAGFAIIPWYTSTVYNKVSLGMSGAGDATSSLIDGELTWGFYNPAVQAAISSLSVSAPPGGGSFFRTGTSFGLYGIA